MWCAMFHAGGESVVGALVRSTGVHGTATALCTSFRSCDCFVQLSPVRGVFSPLHSNRCEPPCPRPVRGRAPHGDSGTMTEHTDACNAVRSLHGLHRRGCTVVPTSGYYGTLVRDRIANCVHARWDMWGTDTERKRMGRGCSGHVDAFAKFWGECAALPSGRSVVVASACPRAVHVH